ncbi:MAG: YdcF family protein [Proteobacteria bacterium]|nr:YdcF family protein [Pseudomonadota bacterium]
MLKQSVLYSLRLLMVAAVGGSLWLAGLVLFTRLIPSSPEDTTTSTDGIVIFTGGETRLQVALSLFEQKKGKYLLISGVNPESSLSKTVDQMPFKSQVTLGYEALDTLGNAEETAAWAEANRIRTLRLITSNYHMPRSLFELRRLLPEVQILSHAVVGKSFLKPKWWIHPATLSLVIQEYNKFLFALLRRPLEDMQEFFTAREKT